MVCLGFEPGAAGWQQVQTNQLSYCGTQQQCLSIFKSQQQSFVSVMAIPSGEKIINFCLFGRVDFMLQLATKEVFFGAQLEVIFKLSNPASFGVFSFFQTQILQKTVGFRGIRTHNVGIEGEHSGHLTTTTTAETQPQAILIFTHSFYLLLLGSPVFMNPHLSQQHTGLQHTVIRR